MHKARKAMTSKLEARNGRVIKRYASDELEEVRDKYSLLSGVEKNREILVVTPICEDQRSGALAFPEVRGLEPIRTVLFGTKASRARDANHVIDLCAKGLALVHSVRLDKYPERSLTIWSHPGVEPSEFDGGAVLLHGDFGFSNLFVVRRPESPAISRLVIIDAEADGYFTLRHLQAGSRYVDLAMMTSCLLGRLGAWGSLFVARDTCEQYISTLAARYELHSGFRVSLPRLRDYTSACVRSYFARKFSSQLLTRLASAVLLKRFPLFNTWGAH